MKSLVTYCVCLFGVRSSLWLCLMHLAEEVLKAKRKTTKRGCWTGNTLRANCTVWFGGTCSHRSSLAWGLAWLPLPACGGSWLLPLLAFRCTCKRQTPAAVSTSKSSKGISGLCHCPFSLGQVALGGHCSFASERWPWYFLSAASFSRNRQ